MDANEIIPGLYLGSYKTVKSRWARNRLNQKMGVTHVLSVCDELDVPKQDARFKWKHVMLTDLPNADLTSHLDDSLFFIERALSGGGRVLVHCHMGISRSASVVCSYLMNHWDEPGADDHKGTNPEKKLRKVLALVKKIRPVVDPNGGFLRQIEEHARKRAHARENMAHLVG